MGKPGPRSASNSRSEGAHKKLQWLGLIVLGILLALAGVLAWKWPYTRSAMTQRLERASAGHVEIQKFRRTWFPYPGCVAEDVVFRKAGGEGAPRGEQSAPWLTIHTLTVQSTYPGLFSRPRRIKEIIAEGARIHLLRGESSPVGAGTNSGKGHPEGEQLVIEKLRVENAVLEIASVRTASGSRQKSVSGNGRKTVPGGEKKAEAAGQQRIALRTEKDAASGDEQKPLVFQIHRAIFHNLSRQNTVPFEVAVRIPLLPGEVQSGGWIGPAKSLENFRQIPVSGFYALQRADLGIVHSLGGHVSSRGEFSGTLERLNVSGSTDTPDFEVTASRHQFHLSTRFRGVLDLKNGDLSLPSLTAKLGSIHLDAHARIYGSPKTVELAVARGKGEVQDLVLLFSKAPRSAVTGPVSFHAVAVLPPEHRPFKERVQLTGDFVVAPAHFSSPRTQEHVDQLSERAQGKKDKQKDYDSDDDAAGFESVVTELHGRVALKNGTAAFSEISFSVPGAEADMNGTYSLVSKKVNLRGKMRMQATVSQATTGAKSVFLKVLDPLFRKKGAGAEVNVAMTGIYGHTRFKAGLR
jgi:hypothetical protein